MYFARPEAFFLCLVLIPIFFLLRHSLRTDRVVLAAFKEESSPTRSYFLFVFIWLVFIGSLGAVLAKPQRDIYAPQEVLSRADIVLLVDVSRSMEARSSVDAPSRLETVQDIMREIVNKIPNARFLVFGYSSLAFSLSSFSNDYDYLLDVIEKGLYIEVIPAPGSRLPNALAAVAIEKIENPQYENVSHVVLFSDGATVNILRDDGSTERAIRFLEQANLSVVSIGVGSKDGDFIPLFDKGRRFTGEYVTLDTGAIFESFLREDTLREFSDRTGGVYFSQDDRREIISYIRNTLPRNEFSPEVLPEVQEIRDVGWIFYPSFGLALIALLLKRRSFY